MMSNDDLYDEVDFDLNYRENSSQYRIGRGEFGVLMYQPYKAEILPNWKYKNQDVAERGAKRIFRLFHYYLEQGDFPGADMARKYLQMGFTRAMRYAKYPGGKKYDDDGNQREQQKWADPEKREAAVVYKDYWDKARENSVYQRMKDEHRTELDNRQQLLSEVEV